jgi:hypothetical protein
MHGSETKQTVDNLGTTLVAGCRSIVAVPEISFPQVSSANKQPEFPDEIDLYVMLLVLGEQCLVRLATSGHWFPPSTFGTHSLNCSTLSMILTGSGFLSSAIRCT